MQPKRILKMRCASAAVVAALAVAGTAAAGTLPKEGSYDYTACWSGVPTMIGFSKTHFAFSYEMTGTNFSNPPGGLFDKNTFRCVGMNATLGSERVGNLVCEAVDRDGDKRLAYFALGKDGKYARQEVAGTGKYQGMVTDGQIEEMGPFPVIKRGTFQNCNHQTGTYRLK
jgi:hypothetical protein